MTSDTHLEKLFRDYLISRQSFEVGRELCQALSRVGLQAESYALSKYIKGELDKPLALKWGRQERACFVGPILPTSARPGDLWFDNVELTLMLLVPHAKTDSPSMWNWLATHPVYTWQFRTFMSLVKWRLIQKHFMQAPDLMSADRFENVPAMAYVTNVYQAWRWGRP